jgi:hypothetical protein
MESLKFFEILCPGCQTEYRIPVEHCGRDAVCCNTKCGIMFRIPTFAELNSAEEVIEPDVPEEEISTSTVKIHRRNIGMIPDPRTQQGLDTSNFVLMPDSSRPKTKKRIFHI